MTRRVNVVALLCIVVLLATLSDAVAQMNLISNGDFSQGNTGFSSDFISFTSTNTGAKQYGIVSNPALAHRVNGTASYFDHTLGDPNGLMFMANGIDDINDTERVAWSQSVPVEPNTTYDFTTWTSTWFPNTPVAELQLQINGETVGSPFTAPASTRIWQEFSSEWTSGSDTSSASISLLNTSSQHGGNDFALDDITFFARNAQTPPEPGLSFSFSYGANTPQAVRDAAIAAGNRWSQVFSDNVTVNIDITVDEFEGNSVAAARSNFLTGDYAEFADHISRSDEISSGADIAAVSNLPSSSIDYYINQTRDSPKITDGNPATGISTPYLTSSSRILITRANAKAVGILEPDDSAIDATIDVASNACFDGFGSCGLLQEQIDLVGVFVHEIGHALGFTSAALPVDNNAGDFDEGDITVRVLDLFRYSEESIADNAIDITADNRAKFFSIDGGGNPVIEFSTGVNLGDGAQPGHWRRIEGSEGPFIGGIMDPFTSESDLTISPTDILAFDVIGWDRKRLSNGNFELGTLDGWQQSGAGSADLIAFGEDDNLVLRLTAGSPIAISQLLNLDDENQVLSFDYLIADDSGILDVQVDGLSLLVLHAENTDGFSNATISLEGADSSSVLTFIYDGPTGSNILLDNLAIQAVPEPCTTAPSCFVVLALLKVRGRCASRTLRTLREVRQ